MRVINTGADAVVDLPLAESDPWPGLGVVAALTPLVGVLALVLAVVGLFGWLGPWVVGGTPVAVLFLPLYYVVRRSRPGSVTLVLDGAVLRVVHAGRAPAFDAATLQAAVSLDRLSLTGSAGSLELDLQPLDGDELIELRRLLRELVRRSSGVSV